LPREAAKRVVPSLIARLANLSLFGAGVCRASEPVKNRGVCGLALLSLNNLAKHEKEERREIQGAHTP